jgi:tetratricopeptide (TPR) repeat protein
MLSLEELNDAIQREPDNPVHYDRRSYLHYTAENYEASLDDLDTAIELSGGKKAEYFEHRGMLEYAAGWNDLALDDFNEAVRIGASDASVFAFRGSTYKALQKPAKALADFQTAKALFKEGSEDAKQCQDEIDELTALLSSPDYKPDELFYAKK